MNNDAVLLTGNELRAENAQLRADLADATDRYRALLAEVHQQGRELAYYRAAAIRMGRS